MGKWIDTKYRQIQFNQLQKLASFAEFIFTLYLKTVYISSNDNNNIYIYIEVNTLDPKC